MHVLHWSKQVLILCLAKKEGMARMVYDYYKEEEKKNSKKKFSIKLISLIVVAVAIVLGLVASSIYMEIIQLRELNKAADYSTVFTTNLKYKVIFFAICFVIITAFVYLSNMLIIRNMKKYFVANSIEQRRLLNLPIALGIGFIGAFLTKDFFYNKFLLFMNSIEFGKVDPQFGQDIGYYMFQRPFLMSLFDFLSNLWLFVVIYTVGYYILSLMAALQTTVSWEQLKNKAILRHNLINIAVFFILKTISFKFQREGLLYTSFTRLDINGAGYVDTNIWIKYYTYAPIIVLAIVVLSFIFMWKGKLKNAALSIAIFPIILVVLTLVSTVVQEVIVKPNEFEYEENYIKNNMVQTREAFGLDKIHTYDFDTIEDLTPEIINRNRNTIDNIRVVDYTPTLESNKQLQSNTNFYTFANGDILNYTINGKEIPVFISAREVNADKLQNQNFVNKTFKYTHGYGVVVNPINKLTSQGQVEFLLSGLKMDTVDKETLKITEPRIYYGELTNNFVIVNPEGSGKMKEIDYDGNVETSFKDESNSKISLNLLNRMLFAGKYADANILVSSNISSNSKILPNRNVVQRAQMGVPFLKVDDDPALVITDNGKLVWVLDAYTMSANYPTAQTLYTQSSDSQLRSLNGINYIRNSVKITVDAYNGDVKYYIIDKEDPIIKVYQKIYPNVFTEESLPEDILSHIRYPELLFKVQTEMLKKYHINPSTHKENISTFYTNQDAWNIANYPDKTSATGFREIDAYYNMIKLPDDLGDKEELILMRPFTPSGEKHNMVSWLAVRNSGDKYGEMILFNFPKDTNILGPDQVEVNINQISEISESMTLWGQGGSDVFKGSLLVIPIEQSILYVEPIYIQSESKSSIPQIRKVVVGYQQGADLKHGIGNNLDEALDNLFGGQLKPSENNKPPVVNEKPDNQGQGSTTTTPSAFDAAALDELQKKLDELMKQSQEINDLLNKLKGQ